MLLFINSFELLYDLSCNPKIHYQKTEMSIKDRIKFFQNLNNNKQQPKPFPKPLPKTFSNNFQQSKPVTTLTGSIKSTHENKLQPKPQSKHEIKPQANPQVQTDIKQQGQVPQQPIHIPIQKIPPKSAEVISQPPIPPVLAFQPPKQHENRNKNPEVNVQKVETGIMSVKDRLKLLQQSNSKPLTVQQPPVMKSCFVVEKKVNKQESASQTLNNKQENNDSDKRGSMPQISVNIQTQKKLTFKEMRQIAQSLLKKAQNPPKLQQTQANSNGQSQQTDHDQNTILLQQQVQTLQEEVHKEKDPVQNNTATESEILFQQALKQAEPTLVTGQSANLTLGVRRTMAKRRNNDDFDDL